MGVPFVILVFMMGLSGLVAKPAQRSFVVSPVLAYLDAQL